MPPHRPTASAGSGRGRDRDTAEDGHGHGGGRGRGRGTVVMSTVERVVMTTSGSGGRGAGRDPARGALAPVSHSPPSVTEVVLSFDTTGSMYPYLKEVRERLLDIVKRLQAEAARHKETIRVPGTGRQ